ncbi:MAG: hypothetical protein KAT75_04995, partial [Dehalococcoidia bacterium]|nr:hypothetical protein [Dehalococcoidia bacterium]
ELYDWYQGKLTIEDNWVLGKDQSLTDFIVDIRQVIDAQGITADMSIEPASELLETPLAGDVLEPEELEATGWQLIMTQDFEGIFPTGSWVAFDGDGTTNGEYYWDDDDYKPHWGSWSAWCANGGADGLDPEYYYYPNYMESWMIYGPFDLSDATDAELNFYYWLEAELDYDYFKWYASTNGASFYGWKISGDSGGWLSRSFDLTTVPTLGNLCGESSVWIAFKFDSDSIIVDDGAFVDDIELWKYVDGTPPPAPTLQSPPNYSEVNTLTPTFEWYNVPEADYYGLYISEPPYGPDHLVFDSEEDHGPIYGTSFALPGGILSYGIQYCWNMRGYNTAGWGDFSDAWFFTPEEIHPLPHIDSISPSSGSAGTG